MWTIQLQPDLAVYGSRGGLVCIQQGETSDPKFRVISISPEALAEVINRLQAAARQLVKPEVSTVELRLPDDLAAFLHKTRTKNKRVKSAMHVYGEDEIEFKPLNKLRTEVIEFRPQFEPLLLSDPHRNDCGCYAVTAVDLAGGSLARSLMWLPLEQRYATYDEEHTTMYAFHAEVTWTVMMKDFDRYFRATNNGGDCNWELAGVLQPWPTHPFIVRE